MRPMIFLLTLSIFSLKALADLPVDPRPSQAIRVISHQEEILSGRLVATELSLGGVQIAPYQLIMKDRIIDLVFDQSELPKVPQLLNKVVMITGVQAKVVVRAHPYVAPVFYAYGLEEDFSLKY